MQKRGGFVSPSGVLIADDFRDNLIIDRHDPVFADMRASKIKHLRSANSEDAVTWNVFRSLRQIAPPCMVAWFMATIISRVCLPLRLKGGGQAVAKHPAASRTPLQW